MFRCMARHRRDSGSRAERLEGADPFRIFQELTHEQISSVLAVPVGTVRWRLFEARRKLGDVLRPFLDEIKEG